MRGGDYVEGIADIPLDVNKNYSIDKLEGIDFNNRVKISWMIAGQKIHSTKMEVRTVLEHRE